MKHYTNLPQSIEKNWLTWLSLHHFLPNNNLLKLLGVILKTLPFGIEKNLNDIFEITNIHTEDSVISNLYVIKISTSNQQILFFQSLLQNIFLKNDNYFEDIKMINFHNSGQSEEIDNSIKTVLVALILGCQELLGATKNALNIYKTPELQENKGFIILCKSLINIKDTLDKKDNSKNTWEKISEDSFFENDILGPLIIKHLADLVLEKDEIKMALQGYLQAKKLIKRIKPDETCKTEYKLWTDTIEHSIISCQRTIKGPKISIGSLFNKIEKSNFKNNLPFLINLKRDLEYDLSHLSFNLTEKLESKQTYITSVDENFLATSNFYERNYIKKEIDSYTLRSVRAKLRRQIAIGSNYHTRTLRTLYGKAIICQFLNNPFNKKVFLNGIKQIIESEFYNVINEISQESEWEPFQLNENLDNDSFQELFEHCFKYDGSKKARLRVFVEFLNNWSEKSKSEKLILNIWKFYIQIAKEFESDFHGNINAAGISLVNLKRLANNYSNLKSNFSNDILDLLRINLNKETFWKGLSDTLELVIEYIDSFNEEESLNALEYITNFLKKYTPGQLSWPVERAAIKLILLIMSGAKLNKNNIKPETYEMLLKFGFNEEGNSILIFGFLKDFPKEIIKNFNIKENIKPAINSLMEDASQYNSSRTSSSIHALLTILDYLNEAEKDTVITHINQIMNNVLSETNRHDLAFETLYNPLLYLINLFDSKKVDQDTNWLKSLLENLFIKIISIWDKAKEYPELFSDISSHRSQEIDIIEASNWAITSIRLAKSLDKLDELRNKLLLNFKDNKQFKMIILKVLISENIYSKEISESDLEFVIEQYKDIKTASDFYQLLPLVLVGFHKFENSEKVAFLNNSFNKILEFGPKAIDASIFPLILQFSSDRFNVEKLILQGYRNRILSSNEEIKALLPIFDAVFIKLIPE